MITINMSLAEVVKEFPGATELFNEYKLDYCCGGKQLLKEALSEFNLNEDQVISRLNDEQEQYEANKKSKLNTNLYSFNTSDLIDAIEENHHFDERKLLYELDELVNKILIVHYDHHKEDLIKIHDLFAELKKELEKHFVKEEQIVFPLMKKAGMDREELNSLIEELKAEHDAAGEIIKELLHVTNDFIVPDGVCPTYILTYEKLKTLVNDIFLHIYTETSILFKKFEN